MREAYLKLGQNEPIDQTDFANHLIGEYPAIDSSNVALWGWVSGTEIYFESYGNGFLKQQKSKNLALDFQQFFCVYRYIFFFYINKN